MSDTAASGTAVAKENLAGTWTIDPSHSGVEFSVTHLMISKVKGGFPAMSGTVVSDGTPEGSHVEVQIETASVNTREPARDTHLRSADFFDVEKYPHIRFVSTAIKPRGDNDFKVTGDLTISGVTRSLDVDVTQEGFVRDPWGADRVGFSGSTRIDRRDFGLTYNQALEAGGVLVSNEVRLTFDVELTRKND